MNAWYWWCNRQHRIAIIMQREKPQQQVVQRCNCVRSLAELLHAVCSLFSVNGKRSKDKNATAGNNESCSK